MKSAQELRVVKNATVLVLKDIRYVLLTLLVSIAVLFFSIAVINLDLVFGSIAPSYSLVDKVVLVVRLFGGLITNNTPVGLVILLATALLAGLNVSLLAFKVRVLKAFDYREGGAGTGGTFAGLLASGCSACGIGILSLLGLTGGLLFLPFGGLELGVVGIVLLLFSLYWTSKGIMGCSILK